LTSKRHRAVAIFFKWFNDFFHSSSLFARFTTPGSPFEFAHLVDLLIEQWRVHYNTIRPHSALGYRPPAPEIIVPGKGLPMNHEAA